MERANLPVSERVSKRGMGVVEGGEGEGEGVGLGRRGGVDGGDEVGHVVAGAEEGRVDAESADVGFDAGFGVEVGDFGEDAFADFLGC